MPSRVSTKSSIRLIQLKVSKLIVGFFLSLSALYFTQAMPNGGDVLAFVSEKAPSTSLVGLYICDQDGNVVAELNAHKLFIPASLTKIVTSLLAWEVLGPEFRFTTTVYVPKGSAPPVVRGSVVIKGNGDPSLSLDTLRVHLRKFRQDGYTTIDGNIVVDNSFFSDERWGRGWEWDYRNPTVDAIVLREYTLSFKPEDKNGMALLVGGKVKEVLEEYGVKVTGRPTVGKLNSGYEEYIVVRSPTLKAILDIVNKYSNNSYAEQVTRTVALRLHGLGSVNNSIVAIRGFVSKIVGEYYPYRILDGSGLSTYNLLSPFLVVQVLLYGYRNHGGLDGYISTIPLSGREGLMEKRLGDIYVRGKSGTLQGVSNFAGVMRTRSGRLLFFAIMVNGFIVPTYQVMSFQDELLRFVWRNY